MIYFEKKRCIRLYLSSFLKKSKCIINKILASKFLLSYESNQENWQETNTNEAKKIKSDNKKRHFKIIILNNLNFYF